MLHLSSFLTLRLSLTRLNTLDKTQNAIHTQNQHPLHTNSFAAAHGCPDGVEFVVLELSPVSHIDAMGAAFFDELLTTYRARGVQLVLSNPSARVLRTLERSGFLGRLGREWVFVRVHDAVVYCKAHTRVAIAAADGDGVIGGGAGGGNGGERGDDDDGIVVDATSAGAGSAASGGSHHRQRRGSPAAAGTGGANGAA